METVIFTKVVVESSPRVGSTRFDVKAVEGVYNTKNPSHLNLNLGIILSSYQEWFLPVWAESQSNKSRFTVVGCDVMEVRTMATGRVLGPE